MRKILNNSDIKAEPILFNDIISVTYLYYINVFELINLGYVGIIKSLWWYLIHFN